MNTQLNNFKKSTMGTIKFDAKLPGMRRGQNFIVYPISKDSETTIISCQSENRWLEINTKTGAAEITTAQSRHHNRWLLSMQRATGKSKKFTLSHVDLSALKMHVFTSADKNAGNKVMTTDNSGAINIL